MTLPRIHFRIRSNTIEGHVLWKGHTAECWFRRFGKAFEAHLWRLRWPNHCRECGGTGGTSYLAGYEEPAGFDPCAAEPVEKCHRCGENGLDQDGAGPCTACGWNYDDALPGAYDEVACNGDCLEILDRYRAHNLP